ncbi:ankyrin, partial [Massarina eburnea CBS 473.64]
DVNTTDANGRTPLYWAAWRGDVSNVKELISHGANVNIEDYEGFAPLARAAQAGHLSTVRVLLRANALIDTTTSSWGYQPIHLACENEPNGHKIVKELLDKGANLNAYSRGSGTPLHNAANRGSLETITLL